MSYAATLLRRKLRELAALPEGEPVPSPCISVCRMSAATGLCEGCFRTLDEIGSWSRLSDEGKRVVWRALGERAGAAALTPILSQREREQGEP